MDLEPKNLERSALVGELLDPQVAPSSMGTRRGIWSMGSPSHPCSTRENDAEPVQDNDRGGLGATATLIGLRLGLMGKKLAPSFRPSKWPNVEEWDAIILDISMRANMEGQDSEAAPTNMQRSKTMLVGAILINDETYTSRRRRTMYCLDQPNATRWKRLRRGRRK